MKTLLFFLAVFSTLGCINQSVESPDTVSASFFPLHELSSVKEEFFSNKRLNLLWKDYCDFPLRDSGNTIFLAKLSWSGDNVSAECVWEKNRSGATDYASIQLSDGPTDVDARWLICGENALFASALKEAVHNPGSNLVHLGEAIDERDDGTVYIYVGGCHFWDERFCSRYNSRFCKLEDSHEILSVGYAVLDKESGRVHW